MGLGFRKFGNAGSRGQVGAEEKEAGEWQGTHNHQYFHVEIIITAVKTLSCM